MHEIHPSRLLYSLADDFCGPRIIQRESRSRKIANQIIVRLMLLFLPLLHFLDALVRVNCYLLGKACGRKWIFPPTEQPVEIPLSRYLNLAKKHFQAMFKLDFWDPANTVFSIDQDVKAPKEPLISYHLKCSSRLGDNLKGYLNAKWVAHNLGCALLFRPFPHAQELRLGHNQKYTLKSSINLQMHSCFRAIRKGIFDPDKYQLLEPIFYEIPYFNFFHAQIDWSDDEFRQSVIDDLRPSSEDVQIIRPQQGKFNVALHVRTGGAFDIQIPSFHYPTKIPLLQYYDHCLRKVIAERPGAVHVQIFTDALTPGRLLDRFQGIIDASDRDDITLACSGDTSDQATVKDMLSMAAFDCLVRPDSGLSEMSGLLGRPMQEIILQQTRVVGNRRRIPAIKVIDRQKKGAVLLEENVSIEALLSTK